MVHDELCELKRMAGTTCHCAQRAYDKDPIEGVRNPFSLSEEEASLQSFLEGFGYAGS